MKDYRYLFFVLFVASLSFNFNRLYNFLKYGINIIDFNLVSNYFRLLYNLDYNNKLKLHYFKEV